MVKNEGIFHCQVETLSAKKIEEKLSMIHEQGRNGFLLGLTAQIVSAHVAHNPVKGADLPRLIQAVHQSLA